MATLLSLSPESIGTRCPWILRPTPPSPELTHSLRTLGQLSPVLVVRNDANTPGPDYLLVCGYARVQALTRLRTDILAMEVAADEVRCCLLYLDSNRTYATPQPDTGLALAALRFLQPRMEPDALDETLAPRLGLAPKSRGWRRLKNWTTCFSADDPYTKHLLEGRLPLDLIDELQKMRASEYQALEPFFAAFGWSRSAALQFCNLLRETSLATQKDIATLLKEAKLNRVLEAVLEAGLSPKDAAARLLDKARALRFPTLLRLQGRFSALVKALEAGTSWRITHTQQFENMALQLTTQVKGRDDLDKVLAELRRMSEADLWDKIWRIVEEETEGGSA